jgi:hypothetical protein
MRSYRRPDARRFGGNLTKVILFVYHKRVFKTTGLFTRAMREVVKNDLPAPNTVTFSRLPANAFVVEIIQGQRHFLGKGSNDPAPLFAASTVIGSISKRKGDMHAVG